MKDENTMNAEDLLTWKGKPDISELLTNTPIHEALPIDQWYAGNKEFNEAMDRADAYLARVIDPLVLLQELDKLQRYQNGVRFSPDNLRRGQMKTKEIYAAVEKLMEKGPYQTLKETEHTCPTVQLQKSGRGLRIPGPVESVEIDWVSAEESVLSNSGVWASPNKQGLWIEFFESLADAIQYGTPKQKYDYLKNNP